MSVSPLHLPHISLHLPHISLHLPGCSFEMKRCALTEEDQALYDAAVDFWDALLQGLEARSLVISPAPGPRGTFPSYHPCSRASRHVP